MNGDLQTKYSNITDLIAEFGHSQAELDRVEAAMAAKQQEALLKHHEDTIRDYVSRNAKTYGQNEKTYSAIVSAYNEAITKIEEYYCNASGNLASKRSKCEENQLLFLTLLGKCDKRIEETKESDKYKEWKYVYDAILKVADLAKNSGDYETYKAKIEEAEEYEKRSPIYNDVNLRNQLKSKVQLGEEQRKKLLQEQAKLNELKNTTCHNAEYKFITSTMSLTKYKSQNLLQKMFNFVASKINRKQRFEVAIQPVRDIIEYVQQGGENFIQYASTMLDVSADKIRNGTTKFNDLVHKIPNATMEKVKGIKGKAEELFHENTNQQGTIASKGSLENLAFEK